MRAERPILLRFLNVLTSLNGFIIKRIVFLFLVKYIASEPKHRKRESNAKLSNLSRIWIGDQCDRWNEPVLAVDDRHVAFCESNGSVARIICVAVATLANENTLRTRF
jgi:hypothetical protein